MDKPMDVLQEFPIRKSKKQKAAFQQAVLAYGKALGYEGGIEKGSVGVRNVVFGDPEQANYVVGAHYDTCAHLPFPNFITPCKFLWYLLYQILVIGGFAVLAILLGVAAALLTKNTDLAPAVGVAVYWALLLLMLFGPANKHNANDNTSGVVSVLELMRTLPEEQRNRVCFVLFDLEEAGLFGSMAYRSKHKKATNRQLIINLDCVGDGDEIVFFPTKKMKKQKTRMEQLQSRLPLAGKKNLTLKSKGFAFYPSDQSNFPLGLGVAAFRKNKLFGLHLGRIHTNRDTILDENNVSVIRDYLLKIIGAQA